MSLVSNIKITKNSIFYVFKVSGTLSQSDDYHVGIIGEDKMCSKLGSMDSSPDQLMSCSNGFYQCFTPIYCNVGAERNEDKCTFAQDFAFTNYEKSHEDYCNSLGYHLSSYSTTESMIPQLLQEKLVGELYKYRQF